MNQVIEEVIDILNGYYIRQEPLIVYLTNGSIIRGRLQGVYSTYVTIYLDENMFLDVLYNSIKHIGADLVI